MPLRRYTHIFFDLDNTLWDFKTNSYYALLSAFHHFSLQEQISDFPRFFSVYSKHNRNLWEAYRQKKIVKKELIRLRFQKTFEEWPVSGTDPEEMNAFYLKEMPGQKRLVEGAVDLLEYLKSRGYYLFIITNGFREVQLKKLEQTGIKKYFTKVFISEEIKSPKPERRIFEYAVKSANAPKKGSLMVGDEPEVDLAGALNFGIDAVLLNNSNGASSQMGPPEKLHGNRVYFIRKLADLKELL